MKFNDFPYVHVDLKDTADKANVLIGRLCSADTGAAFFSAFKDLDALKSEVYSNAEIAAIHHSLDTRDDYWKNENDHYNDLLPVLEEYWQKANDVVFDSVWLGYLKERVPATWFAQAEMDRRAFSPEIIPLLQKESKLADEYQSLIASAAIPFDGGTYTLAQLEKPMKSVDRSVRKMAALAYWGWFDENQTALDEIYDGLVRVRDEMARKLGFENYIPLGYLRMHRLDYGQDDVAAYRKQVLEDIVPLAQRLYEEQAERLHVDHLALWDEKVEFKDGDPAPVCESVELTQRACDMYESLDREVGAFFGMMKERGLLDLDARAGKAAGGYCTFITNQSAPFIFANSNGTEQDVETLCHEAGHAWQAYSSRNIFPIDCIWPTNESAEIHSMSMEFFTWPWMELFFGDRADDYRAMHLGSAVKFLPYGVLVDHFQHEVYAHPQWSAGDRHACWRELEKMYLPHKDYSECAFLESGGWWMRQLHIFMDPFYYIDYTLAQVAALEFWVRMQDGDPAAFEDYKAICRVGGSLPFRSIMELGHLRVPFEKGCLKETARRVDSYFRK